jgi:hypothetical protein
MCFWIIKKIETLDDIRKRAISDLEKFKREINYHVTEDCKTVYDKKTHVKYYRIPTKKYGASKKQIENPTSKGSS